MFRLFPDFFFDGHFAAIFCLYLPTQVLSVGNLFNPDVRYSFNIPIEDKPQQFFWDAYGPWQECSRLCQGEWEAGNKPVNATSTGRARWGSSGQT